MYTGNDFYITLVSDESHDFFNSVNYNTEFSNKLPFALNLNGEYKVALTEIYVPPFYLKSDIEHGNLLERRRREQREDLEIFLNVEDWKIIITNPLLARLKNKTFSIPSMLQFFVCHIDYSGDDGFLPLDVLFHFMVNRLIESLNNIELNDPQLELNVNDVKECVYVEFPVAIENENTLNEKFITKKVAIRATQYSSFKEFLRQIYQQLPKKDRKIAVFVKSLLKSKTDIELDKIKLFRDELIQSITDHANGETENQIEFVFFNRPHIEATPAPALEVHNQKAIANEENNESIIQKSQSGTVNEDSNKKNDDTIIVASTSGQQSNIQSTIISTPRSTVTEDQQKEEEIQRDRQQERDRIKEIVKQLEERLSKKNMQSNPTADETQIVLDDIPTTIETQISYDVQLAYPYPVKRKKNESNILNNTHMLFIYSDIVDFSIYANQLFKLIRIVPFFPLKVNEGVHQIYTSPEYYPLSKTFIDSISIKINNRGEPLRFLNDEIPIFLKLHFKKV